MCACAPRSSASISPAAGCTGATSTTAPRATRPTTSSSTPPAACRCARRSPGIDAAGVHGVQTLDDGAALREELEHGDPERVVVIGGGYIGLEIAEACRVRGLQGHRRRPVAPSRSAPSTPTSARYIGDAVRDEGIDLVLADGGRRHRHGPTAAPAAVVTASGRELPADLVVLGLGVRPNVALAREAGHPARDQRRHRRRRPHAHARPTASGRPATASSPCTGSPGSGSSSRSARTPTSRAGSPGSTSAAATPPSPASSARR